MKDILEEGQENCHVKGVNEEGIYIIPNQGGTTCLKLYHLHVLIRENRDVFLMLKYSFVRGEEVNK